MSSCPTRRTVLFDFDGVFVRRDSTVTFLRRVFRRHPLRAAVAVAPGLAYLALHRVPALQSTLARALLRVAMWGQSEQEIRWQLRKLAGEMAVAESVVVEEAVERLREHLVRGDDVVVVSASFVDFLRPWFEAVAAEDVTLIGSGLRSARWGCVMDPHNHHWRKVTAVRATGRVGPWDVVYTDSLADLPLLANARKAVLVDMTDAQAAIVGRLEGVEVERVRWTREEDRGAFTRE